MKTLLFVFLMAASQAFAVNNIITWDAYDTATYPSVTGILVERARATCATATVWTQINAIWVGNVTYTDVIDDTINAGQYAYRLRATDGVTPSGPSNCVEKLVPSPALPAPANLSIQ